MTITHVVLFHYNPDSGVDAIRKSAQEMVNLQTECIHPTTNQPYILCASGGKDISEEGLQKGMTHGFVMEFASVEDRDYYMKDPAHLAFQKRNRPHLLGAVVVDYENGVM